MSVPSASTPSTTPSAAMGSLLTRMRSRKETRWGEVYRPTRRPAALRMVASIAALDDEIELAVLEEELGALETLRERLTDGLGDDAGSGEADQGSRLGDDHVAEHGEARGDAAGGRIGEHGDVGQTLGSQALERG